MSDTALSDFAFLRAIRRIGERVMRAIAREKCDESSTRRWHQYQAHIARSEWDSHKEPVKVPTTREAFSTLVIQRPGESERRRDREILVL